VGWERESEGQKQEKFMGRDEDSLISKAEWHMQAKQNKEFIHYFPSVGRCSAISRKQEFVVCNGYLGRQML